MDYTNPKEHDQEMALQMKSVHPYVMLDYKHNCSHVTNPDNLKDIVACFTEEAEAETMRRFGLDDTMISDDAACEWGYFWMDICLTDADS